MTVPVVSMLLLSFLLFAAPSEAAFQSVYTYAMDCCPSQANVTVDALSQCGNLCRITRPKGHHNKSCVSTGNTSFLYFRLQSQSHSESYQREPS